MSKYEDLINQYGKGKKVREEDKSSFFDKLKKLIPWENLETLWHAIMHIDCAKNIFSTWEITMMIAAVAYVLSPLDAIPDAIIFAGLLDDAAVVSWLVSTLDDRLGQYRKECM